MSWPWGFEDYNCLEHGSPAILSLDIMCMNVLKWLTLLYNGDGWWIARQAWD